ncbi:hypothetical protein CgunFtcFv8_008504 [Champsocephalus gunnari]|uniref:Uncharacterized protein n=1 Tax=Champsocephalus gunnari TaxID=52237 RepID=A0AAN8D1F2_CHAGU|nr:hypothetical protein CgunFtcFv8_008504 [Champsocephalus gunnari]
MNSRDSTGNEQAGQAGPATLAEWKLRGRRRRTVILLEVVYVQTQVKQTTGCQEATYLHYLISGCSVML